MNRRSFMKSSAVMAGAGVSGVGLKDLLRERIVFDFRKDRPDDFWEYLQLLGDCKRFANLAEAVDGSHYKIIDSDGSVYYETGQQS